MTTGAGQNRANDERTGAPPSRQRSLEQHRASAAWEAVARVTGQGYAKEYRALAMSAPADIQVNGLGQTLAFWRAKGKSEHTRLYDDVSGWVCARLNVGGVHLLTWITRTASTNDYRRATVEAFAFLGWVKRFAEAELPRDGGGPP